MTNDEIKRYYADLLILQYVGKAKAYATIKALVDGAIMDQLPLAVQNAFDISTAVGVQLDTIGVIVGVQRTGFTFSGPVSLSDADFRTLIGLVIARNSLNADFSSIVEFIFNNMSGTVSVYDYLNMHMSYLYNVPIGSNLPIEFFIRLGLLPKPMGVQLTELVYVIGKPFGFRTYVYQSPDISPFNSYLAYETDEPWISYANGIPI